MALTSSAGRCSATAASAVPTARRRRRGRGYRRNRSHRTRGRYESGRAAVAAAPDFVVRGRTTSGEVAWSYLVLGVQHILGGVDHLLFVLGTAADRARRQAHRRHRHRVHRRAQHHAGRRDASAGCTCPARRWKHDRAQHRVRGVGSGARTARPPGLTARAPWIVAFSFGLLHGFGFAGALAEVGLPQTRDSDRAADVQRRRRSGAADVHRRRARDRRLAETVHRALASSDSLRCSRTRSARWRCSG